MSTTKNIHKALEERIVELVDVEIPETLIDEQTKTKFANMMSDFKAKGMDDAQVKSMITKENFEKYKKTSYDNTVRSLRISFVIGDKSSFSLFLQRFIWLSVSSALISLFHVRTYKNGLL